MEGDLYTDIDLMWLDTDEMLLQVTAIKSCPMDQDLKINVSKLCHGQLTNYSGNTETLAHNKKKSFAAVFYKGLITVLLFLVIHLWNQSGALFSDASWCLWEILNLKQFCQHNNFWSAHVFPSTQPRLKALNFTKVTDFKVKEHNTIWPDSTIFREDLNF